MSDFYIKKNDRLPPLTSTLKYADGTAINLAGTTVRFLLRKPDGIAAAGTGILSVLDASAGTVKYEWAAIDTDQTGIMLGEWEIEFPNTEKLTVPNRGNISILVSPELA